MESFDKQNYPKRPSAEVQENVRALTLIQSGEVPAWEVSEAERNEILVIESSLASRFEPIFILRTPSVTFDIAYLLTAEGRTDFSEVVGITIPEQSTTPEAIQIFLYSITDTLFAIDSRARLELTGRTQKYRKTKIFKSIAPSINQIGEIDVSQTHESDSVTMQLKPDVDLVKHEQLRTFKETLKEERAQLRTAGKSDDYVQSLDGIFVLYQRKINELLAQRADVVQNIKSKADLLGQPALSEAESLILQNSFATVNSERDLSRYDKFLYGAGELNEAGWREQISAELLSFAQIMEQESIRTSQNKKTEIEGKGLDFEKVMAKTVPVEVIIQKCMETLAHYGLLSSEPASSYTPDRSGPAVDGKWQVIVGGGYSKPSTDKVQRVIKFPNTMQSVDKLLSVYIAHEIEGHVLQHANQANIPLQFFEKFGSDRAAIIAEAGAMDNQSKVTKELFGYTSPPVAGYVRAMVVKLNGGTYADCVQAYYLSTIKGLQAELQTGELEQVAFNKECRKKLQTAISSTSRLFAGNLSSKDATSFLLHSKDTVYIEQVRLAAALNESGLDEILYLNGVNFSALEFLMRAKMISLDEIKKPDFYVYTVWEEMKNNYKHTVT